MRPAHFAALGSVFLFLGCAFLFNTDPFASGPPDAVSDLNGCTVSPFTNRLSWQEPSFDVDGFRIERRDTQGAPAFVDIASVDAGTTTYLDTNLNWNWQYDYQVIAYNADGDSDAGAAVTIYTLKTCDGGIYLRDGGVES